MEPNLSQSPPPKKSHVLPIILIILGIVFMTVSLAILGIITKNNQSKSSITKSDQPTTNVDTPSTNTQIWEKPASNQKGYPITTNGTKENTRKLQMYSLTGSKLFDIQGPNEIVGLGGAVGFGATDPLPSPDLFYTAYIDDKTRNLWLVSNKTGETRQITTSGYVTYVSEWSPDSTQVLYYVSPDTIAIRAQGQGGLEGASTKFDPTLQGGFYIFNINTGKTTNLYPVTYFLNFIDNDRLLVQTGDQNWKDRLIIFSVSKFDADYKSIKDTFGFGAGQYSFTEEGKYWSYSLSRHPTDDGNIIYAPFPKKEEVQVDTGTWSGIQFPKISPKGTKIAYMKKDTEDAIWVYDTKTQQKEKIVEGSPVSWIDETSLIGKRYVTDKFLYSIVNTDTKSVKQIQ